MPPDAVFTARRSGHWGWQRMTLVLLACITGWAVVALICLCVGSTGRQWGWPEREILPYRLEPVLLASIVGAALASAGAVYQAVLRNPLSDPYLLGVSSGATLWAFAWQVFGGAGFSVVAAALGQQFFAFIGAISTIAVVFFLAGRRGRIQPVTLLLVGVIVNAVNGSLFMLLNTLKQDFASGNGGVLTFLAGGLQSNLTSGQRWMSASGVGVGWCVLMLFAGELNVATLGETEARSLGVRIHRLRWITLIVSSLITACAVAVSGPIGFIGLICPHIARLVVGTDQRRVLPVATAVGAALLAIADAASRYLSNPHWVQTALPVGVLTGLLGGPFFLALLWQAKIKEN